MINNSSRISQTSHGVGESLIDSSAIFTPRYVRCKQKKPEKTQTIPKQAPIQKSSD
jgi:hypothetical protein